MELYAYFIILSLLPISQSYKKCSNGTKRCEWNSWQDWEESCSTHCGGGYQSRWRSPCCKVVNDEVIDNDQCYKECTMKINEEDKIEYRSCGEKCHHGRFIYHDDSSHNVFGHCTCSRGYSGICCDIPLCGWGGRWCWPGRCGDYNHEIDCRCDSGFRKEKVGSSTMCQLSKRPTLTTCRAGLVDVFWDAVNTTGTGSCSKSKSVYTNLKPHKLSYKLDSKFSIESTSSRSRNRIEHSHFGIVDNRVEIIKKDIRNTENTINSGRASCDNLASDSHPQQLVTCSGTLMPNRVLSNGER